MIIYLVNYKYNLMNYGKLMLSNNNNNYRQNSILYQNFKFKNIQIQKKSNNIYKLYILKSYLEL